MLSKDTKNNHIIVKKTHFVRCSDPQNFKSLPSPFWLSPMEQLSHHSVAIDTAWIYESFPDLSKPVCISRLRAAFTRLLDYFPTLTGQLSVQPQKGSRSLDRFDTGINLLEATCIDPLAAFYDPKEGSLDIFNFPENGEALSGPWEGTAESAQRNPLPTVQHTRFVCGLIALGLRATHTVCDASGSLQLYQDLAKLYRAPKPGFDIEVTLAQAPCIESYMLDKIGSLSPEERAVALEYQPPRFSVIETNEKQE